MTTPTHPVQVYMANSGERTGDSQSSHGRRKTITPSESAMARVQAAVTGGTPLGSDVTREELMVYQKLLYEQAQRLRRRTEELDALQRRAEASSEWRAQLSSLRSSVSVYTPRSREHTCHHSRLDDIPEASRREATRSLESSFMMVDPAGNVLPKTP